MPKDDPIKRKSAIDLAIQKLNWKPQVGLDDGLRKTVSYFEKNIDKCVKLV